MNEQKPKTAERQKTINMAALRAAVAVYLIYLGVSLVRDRLQGNSTLPPALAWVAGLVFLLAGAAFGWYAWRRWQSERDTAAENEEAAGEEP